MKMHSLSWIVALMLVLATPARAEPTIHVFGVFCDAYQGDAGNINQSVTADRYMVEETFCDHIPQQGWGVQVRMNILSGANASEAEIFRRWELLSGQVGPEDTVYVHFSGHGIILDPASGVQFLETVDSKAINRNGWAESIAALPCRLKIFVTDCCSSYPPTELAEGDDEVEPWETLYFLLLRHEGFVDITAASPGQYAFGTARGGYLTVNLHSDMQRFRTWEAVFGAASERVWEETTELLRGEGDSDTSPQRPVAYGLGRALPGTGADTAMPEAVAWIIPDSNRRALTEAELSSMSLQQLYLARNEVFARHGYDFGTPLLQRYFGSRSWYRAKPGFKSPSLSDVETRNAELILAVEKDNGGPFISPAKSLPGDGSTAAVPDMFPYSSQQPLPRSVLQGLTAQELSIARNEIFARHGYPFRSKALQNYFARKPWYRRNPRMTDPPFNSVEKQNVWLIRKIERIQGGAYSW